MAMEKEVDAAVLAGVKARAAEVHQKFVRDNSATELKRTREEALALLQSWVASESLRKHALAVEAAMKGYAKKFGEDELLWGLTGLLHDFDYEKNPTLETHVLVGIPVLAELGYPPALLDAIMGHADYFELPRATKLSQTLFAVDELSGFLTALAYIRPNKSLAGLEFFSFNKKFKDKAFARSVNRDDILKGASELGIALPEHVTFVAAAVQTVTG